MDAEKAAEQLSVIRQLMERPVRYSTQSGLSGILAGIAALLGMWIDSTVSSAYPFETAIWINSAVWTGMFLAAFGSVTVLTYLRERRRAMPFWSPLKMKILRTIALPFIAGVGLTIAIMHRRYVGDGPNQWGLIPAIWMTFYGVALWQVGEFAVVELRIMGVAFVLAGIVAAIKFQADIPGLEPGTAMYWTLGITFGGFHIIYGIIVWIRHGG